MLSDKVYVGLDYAPRPFDLCNRVLGQGGANLDFIRSETGAMVILKGGAGDKMNPLHLALNHMRGERLAAARTLALSLVESVRQEFQQWSLQNAPTMPALNMPPPVIVNPTAGPPPVAVATSVAPQVAPPPINMAPLQPQVLQLVPQQQIFVAQDGTHYVKVTFAQTPTANVAPVTAMSLVPGQVSVVPQAMHMAQMQGLAPPPLLHAPDALPNLVPSPSVCAAPTLSTQGTALHQHQMGAITGDNCVMQPWGPVPQQVAPVPAPVAPQINTAPPRPSNMAPANTWSVPAPLQQNQNTNRPWGEPNQPNQQPANQMNSVGGNIPWYKNSQNTASSTVQIKQNDNRPRVIVDEWEESGDRNNTVPGIPLVWESRSVSANLKASMPDLLEEINKEKEREEGEGKPRSGRDHGRDNHGGGRRDRRERRRDRRPYTDAGVYRRQFCLGGVLGEERNTFNDKTSVQEGEQNQLPPVEQQAPDAQSQGQVPVAQGGTQRPERYSVGPPAGRAGQGQAPASTILVSKWDRSSTGQPLTNQYNQPPANNYQQQQQAHQYQNQNQYQQPPGAYGQPAAQQNKQPAGQQPPAAADGQAGPAYDKQTPTTQYVGAPTQYAAPVNSNWSDFKNGQYYQNEPKPTWNQSQHPWNRNAQSGRPSTGGQGDGGQYGNRPWNNAHAVLPPPPPPPAISGNHYWTY